MLTQEKQRYQGPAIQRANCAGCPYFDPNQGVHGWCNVFDRMAKPLHERTGICDQEIEALLKHVQQQPQPKPQFTDVDAEFDSVRQPKPQWSITWDSKWHWYNAWVGKSYAGNASTAEEAERLAQKYIASHNSWQQHREKVLAAYAD